MKVCESETRKVFKIGDSLALTIPSKMLEKYYRIREGEDVEISVYSSDKGLHFSFWKKGE